MRLAQELRLIRACILNAEFNPDQPRNEKGEWTDSGESPEAKLARYKQAGGDAQHKYISRGESWSTPRQMIELKIPYTSAEKAAINAYKKDSSSVNSYLRKLANGEPTTLNNEVVQLHSALAKGSIKEDMVVFRGFGRVAGSTYGEKLAKSAKPGMIIKAEYFQEASMRYQTAASYGTKALLRINVKKGTPAISTYGIRAAHADEKGIIFSNNVSYKVKNVYDRVARDGDDVKIIEVDLIA